MQLRPTKTEIPVSVQNLDSLPDTALLDLKCIISLTSKSRATIYRWIEIGILPKPRKLGATRNFWSAGEIRRALGIEGQP